jgi:hypothetical protein
MNRFADVITLASTRAANPLAAGIDRFVGLEHIEPENLHIRKWGNVADGTTFTSTFKSGNSKSETETGSMFAIIVLRPFDRLRTSLRFFAKVAKS